MASTSGWPHNFSAFSFGPPPSPFEPPSFTYRLLSSPLRFFAQHLYALILLLRGSSYASPTPFARIRLVCISDTHTHKATPVPPGDVLIHSGDLTNDGTVAELQDQVDWLSSLPHRYKIAIAGNHDCYLDPKSRRREDNGRTVDWKDIHYLQHANLTLSFSAHRNRRLTFYGAPQIPQCGGDDFAFQYPNRKDIWSNTIPKGTDVLITHTPPRHHLDLPQGMGCEHLLNEIWTVKPKVHVFGHVHAGYGREYASWDTSQQIYERLCAREEKGVLTDLVALQVWVNVVRLAAFGALAIIWSRLWRGDDSGTLLVNAALMYRSTGELRNAPQVVDI